MHRQREDHMKKQLTVLFVTIIVCLVCLTGSAHAQWTDNMGGNWNNPTSASIGNIINDQLWNRMFAKARARDKAKGRTGSASSTDDQTAAAQPTQKTPAQIDAAVRFRPTGTQLETQAITDELSAGGTPEAKQQMFTILSTLLTEYEKAARAQGKPNDLALAITAALVYNSSIYNGTPEPSDARIMEIRDALAELAAEDGTFAKITDREKQVLYEKIVISTMLAKAGYEDAKSKGATAEMAIYRNLAGQTLQAVSGMPPEKINLNVQSPPTNGPDAAPSQGSARATQSIAATALVIAYDENELRASQMYGGKRIRVNGAVNHIEVEKNGMITLTFVSPASKVTKTQCQFNKSQGAGLAELRSGQEATVEGTVTGYGDGNFGKWYIVLKDCSIPGASVSPENIDQSRQQDTGIGTSTGAGEAIEHWVILQDFKDNRVAAESKYLNKRVRIVGPVDFVLIENGLPVLRMGVPAWSGQQMFCVFPISQKAGIANIKVNQRVAMECTVRGEVGGVSRVNRVDLGSSVGRLTLNDCTLL
jgi:hypothetical protein